MSEEKEMANYYSIIPAKVRYDGNLSPMEKLIFGEIMCLTTSSGVCYAKNKHFSGVYDITERQVSSCISMLEMMKYITIKTNGSDRTIEVNFEVVGSKFLTTKKNISNLYNNNISNNKYNNSTEKLSLRTDVKKDLPKAPPMPRSFIVGVMTHYGNAQGWKDEDTAKAYRIFARMCKELFLLSGGNLQQVKNAIDWVKAQRYPSWTLNAVLKHWNDFKKPSKAESLPEL